MPTHYTDPLITCDGCGATRDRQVTKGIGLEAYKAEAKAFLESGWKVVFNPYERPLRLLPHTSIVSCPDCPPAEPGDPEGRYREAGSRPIRSRQTARLTGP